MKVIKKYTAIKLGEKTIDDTQIPTFEYGDIEVSYYSKEYPKKEFDSEGEAIQYAYDSGKYENWLIVPIIKFDNF